MAQAGLSTAARSHGLLPVVACVPPRTSHGAARYWMDGHAVQDRWRVFRAHPRGV